jgi:hypothetical protein
LLAGAFFAAFLLEVFLRCLAMLFPPAQILARSRRVRKTRAAFCSRQEELSLAPTKIASITIGPPSKSAVLLGFSR